jgi:GNAT superfamily N-acetyltransferase
MPVEIKFLRVADLASYIVSEEYRSSPVLPIAPLRALSQAQNPRAQPQDLALALAYADGQLVGYLGALPDLLHFPDAAPCRVAWLSCLWVSPAVRGQGLAKKLLQSVAEAWEHRVLLTDYAPAARGAFLGSGVLAESAFIEGFRGYLRPDFAQLLAARGGMWAKTKPLLQAADAVLRPLNALRIHWKKPRMPPTRVVEEVSALAWDLIRTCQTGEIARRDPATLQWMLQCQWVRAAARPDAFAERYHFTSSARQFRFEMLEVLDDVGEPVGFLALCLRDGHLRVPHAWYPDAYAGRVARAIFGYAIRHGARMVTMFHPRLVQYCRTNPTPFFAGRTMRRSYFLGKNLPEMGKGAPSGWQDGDGDVGFT